MNPKSSAVCFGNLFALYFANSVLDSSSVHWTKTELELCTAQIFQVLITKQTLTSLNPYSGSRSTTCPLTRCRLPSGAMPTHSKTPKPKPPTCKLFPSPLWLFTGPDWISTNFFASGLFRKTTKLVSGQEVSPSTTLTRFMSLVRLKSGLYFSQSIFETAQAKEQLNGQKNLQNIQAKTQPTDSKISKMDFKISIFQILNFQYLCQKTDHLF